MTVTPERKVFERAWGWTIEGLQPYSNPPPATGMMHEFSLVRFI
jgi:hypothetical protein